jgi:hypothetical protein
VGSRKTPRDETERRERKDRRSETKGKRSKRKDGKSVADPNQKGRKRRGKK